MLEEVYYIVCGRLSSPEFVVCHFYKAAVASVHREDVRQLYHFSVTIIRRARVRVCWYR